MFLVSHLFFIILLFVAVSTRVENITFYSLSLAQIFFIFFCFFSTLCAQTKRPSSDIVVHFFYAKSILIFFSSIKVNISSFVFLISEISMLLFVDAAHGIRLHLRHEIHRLNKTAMCTCNKQALTC